MGLPLLYLAMSAEQEFIKYSLQCVFENAIIWCRIFLIPQYVVLVELEQVMRIGTGYDVHKLAEGRKLILGGVEIPHEKGLLGHSDADVLVHAIMDALLGALALGDIGKHFPDTDPQYEGASSIELLRYVGGLIEEQNYVVENIDSTIIAQRPKLAPYIDAMRKNVAEALGLEPSRVSIKATTEERLGFTGREEGISSQAVTILAPVANYIYDDIMSVSDCGKGCGKCPNARQ